MSTCLFVNSVYVYNRFMNIREFLLEHYLDWQRREGEYKSLKEFADYLGISDKLLNHYMNGRREPGADSVGLMYQALGDERIFEITGFEKPDARLAFIRRNWGKFTDEEKEQVMRLLSKYRTPGRAVNEPKTTPKPAN